MFKPRTLETLFILLERLQMFCVLNVFVRSPNVSCINVVTPAPSVFLNGPTQEKGVFFYLFGVLRRFQHCTGHITTGSWKGRGNQYIQFAGVVYYKLRTNSKQLPAFPLKAILGIEPRPQRLEARVLPLCDRGPLRERCKSLCKFRKWPNKACERCFFCKSVSCPSCNKCPQCSRRSACGSPTANFLASLGPEGFKSKGSIDPEGKVQPSIQSQTSSHQNPSDKERICQSPQEQLPAGIIAFPPSETSGGKCKGSVLSGSLQQALHGATVAVVTLSPPTSAAKVRSLSWP